MDDVRPTAVDRSLDLDAIEVATEASKPSKSKSVTSPKPEAEEETSHDIMQAYLAEVRKYPLLSPEEEYDYAVRSKEDQRAAHMLVVSNLRLVLSIVKQYRHTGQSDLLELIQEGNAGLAHAVRKFEPTRGNKLSTYAVWWIRAFITRYVVNNKRLVRLGTTSAQRKTFSNLNKQKRELAAEGVEETHLELAKRLEVDESVVAEMDIRLSHDAEISLDKPLFTDGDTRTLADSLQAQDMDVDERLSLERLRSAVNEAVEEFRSHLDEKDKIVLDLRLLHEDPLTLQEIGDKLGVTREAIRLREIRVKGKLKRHLAAAGLDPRKRDELKDST